MDPTSPTSPRSVVQTADGRRYSATTGLVSTSALTSLAHTADTASIQGKLAIAMSKPTGDPGNVPL